MNLYHLNNIRNATLLERGLFSLLHCGEDTAVCVTNSDRPILIFYNDTDYLYVYVPDNRYAEPIFIYWSKVHK